MTEKFRPKVSPALRGHVEWYLSCAWHNQDAEPILDSLVLVMHNNEIEVAKYIGLGAFNNDNGYAEYKGDYQWVYISDLLPG